MQGDDTNIDLRSLFRSIDVPPSAARPEGAVKADLDEMYEKSGMKYAGQLAQRNYGWPHRSRPEKKDDGGDTDKADKTD